MTLQDVFAATLVDEWVRCGLTDAVISPGSRSTPMATALVADGRLRVHVILDERAAGFFALGLGLASARPAVVLTTSGTAAVELHPAVVEAHHAKVPLLVCTADRPPDLHHVGAPQTIEQEFLFVGSVRWSCAPGVAEEATVGTWRSVGSRAVAETITHPTGPGPVHLNLAFREPLSGRADRTIDGRLSGRAWHVKPATKAGPSDDVVAALAAGGRGVIVAGAGAGDPVVVAALADALAWPVLADPRSGCRVPHLRTIAAADSLLRIEEFTVAHGPDVVLRLGAPWASRALADWLNGLDAAQYLVDPFGAWVDPGRSATTLIAADPTLVAEAVLRAKPGAAAPEWANGWAEAERAAQAVFDRVLACDGLSEPALARAVVHSLPDESTLVVSSSMPVRDVEWYGRPRGGLRVLANRGVNGIDGVVSTALGVAVANPRSAGSGEHTVALIGDLAFLHDTNALLVPPGTASGVDCTIVVVDNDGGGIFSFLPQASALEASVFERLLGTPHGLDLVAVAHAHGVSASAATTVDQVVEAVSAPPEGVRVVVVRVPDRSANATLHDRLHREVAGAVGDLRRQG